MTERFETGISSNYLPNWGAVEGIKEFVQNAVYAQTVLGDTVTIEHDGEGVATIKNYPSGFEKGKLLIGESNQRGVAGSPGEYGEGTKVGMCVLLRENRSVIITTNGFTVVPELAPSSLDPSVNTLAFEIEDHDVNMGTIITIQCTEEELEQAKSSFAVLQGVDKELMCKDSILPLEEDKPSIYVNGVRVYTPDECLYSYNFTDVAIMNRDRTTVDIERVKKSVRENLSTNIDSVEQCKDVLKYILNNSQSLEAQSGVSGFISECKLDYWKQAIKEMFGDKVAIATGNESDTQARYRRYKLISGVPYAWTYFFQRLGIVYSDEIVGLNSNKNVHKKPTGERTTNLAWCKRLVKLYVGDYGTVKVSEQLYDSYNNLCDGLYDGSADVIWLRADLLDSKEETFKTLVHETVHRITGASDNTEEFTRGFEQACWNILQRGRK